MKLEAITVCVNYSDFLAWTLPFNKQHFDGMIVITDLNDKKTQNLCEYWYIKCIKVDLSNEKEFPKAKLINIGLDNLIHNDWVLHTDADILVPPHFRRIFELIEKETDTIFHMDRMLCKDYKSWIQFLENPKVQWENDIFVHPGPFEPAVRISQSSKSGCVPIGYFQLWNQNRMNLRYPENHSTAARSDMQFGVQFPRNKRQFLNECIAIHLETILGDGSMGSNWAGRRTPPFTIETLMSENKNEQPKTSE